MSGILVHPLSGTRTPGLQLLHGHCPCLAAVFLVGCCWVLRGPLNVKIASLHGSIFYFYSPLASCVPQSHQWGHNLETADLHLNNSEGDLPVVLCGVTPFSVVDITMQA